MSLKEELKKVAEEAKRLQEHANALVTGKHIRIITDWNGQPYGRSHPSLKGREMIVEEAIVDTDRGVSLFLQGQRLSIMENCVVWLEEK